MFLLFHLFRALATAGMLSAAMMIQLPGGYPSSSQLPQNNPRPYLGAPGGTHRGPPLSTALPSSGPYSRGLSQGAVSTGSRSRVSTSYSSPFAAAPRTSYRNNLNSFRNPAPVVSGASMANVATHRALYAGVF